MQLYCAECREWFKVPIQPGESASQAGARVRCEHRCHAGVAEAFDAIVAAEDWQFL